MAYLAPMSAGIRAAPLSVTMEELRRVSNRRVKALMLEVRETPPESLLLCMEFTIAGQLHRCGYNFEHFVQPGMARLTIRNKGEEHHYCLQCARTLLMQSADHLQLLQTGADQLFKF
jgi:hypothetical protein